MNELLEVEIKKLIKIYKEKARLDGHEFNSDIARGLEIALDLLKSKEYT